MRSKKFLLGVLKESVNCCRLEQLFTKENKFRAETILSRMTCHVWVKHSLIVLKGLFSKKCETVNILDIHPQEKPLGC
jgi:hypothetical protein